MIIKYVVQTTHELLKKCCQIKKYYKKSEYLAQKKLHAIKFRQLILASIKIK